MTLPVVFTANGPSGYNLTKSLRFRSSASAYLNRTFSTPTNNKIWTWSGWVKLGTLSVSRQILSAGSAVSDQIFIGDTNIIRVYLNGGYVFESTPVYRDPSAWYHIVIQVDTTQSTAANRTRVYVNGSQVTAFSGTAITQNTDTKINSAVAHHLGRYAASASEYFDGYLAEVNFIDGQALTPSSFGETSTTTGVWIPKKYTGTYGTNGFYLPFTNTTSTSTLGNDFSGNSNTWTVNNISLTSGSTYDSMNDVPTLTSATTANYAVLNSISSNASLTLTNANLSTPSNQDNKANNGTIGVSTGKWYWEVIVNNNSSICPYIGVTSRSQENDPDISPTVSTAGRSLIRLANPYSYKNYTATSNVNGATNQGTTGTIGVALNLDIGEIKFYNNNTLFHTDTTIPTNGTVLFPYIGLTNSGLGGWNSTAFNFGQQPFAYTPPTGFVALNTFNLPTPTIGATASTQANDYFNVLTYAGSASNQTISGLDFQPDFIWFKERTTSGLDHNLFDSQRSNYGSRLISNTTNAEAASSAIISVSSTGYSLLGGVSNTNDAFGRTYVTWNWKANGAGSTNTAGSITSTVSANTTAGFSIVTYTSPNSSSNQTVGHGLGVKPSMIIVKNRDSAFNWDIYHSSLGYNSSLIFTTAATRSGAFGAEPTSTVFTTTNTYTHNGTDKYVAYCFAPIAGYSAFGSYTGNGSTDGPFVYLGFRPRFVMVKRTDSTGNWSITDTAINPYNNTTGALRPNTSDSESTVGTVYVQPLSNGFKITNNNTDTNASSGTYIYACFAENPFKYSNAR